MEIAAAARSLAAGGGKAHPSYLAAKTINANKYVFLLCSLDEYSNYSGLILHLCTLHMKCVQELLPRQKTTADETFHDDGQQHENHLDSNYKSEGNATAADQHSFAAPVHQSTVKFQRSDNSQPWTEMETLLLKRTRFTTHILPPNTVYDSSGCLDRKKVLKQLMWVQVRKLTSSQVGCRDYRNHDI